MLAITEPLDGLAAAIDREHHAVGVALQSALAHAIAAGVMLIEAKATVKYGQWLKWLTANCSVPRHAAHYMWLARNRETLCDQLGNVLPISVNEAVHMLGHPWEGDGSGYSEWGEYQPFVGWGRPKWGEFGEALRVVTRLTELNPPAPKYIAMAFRAGKTPGLTAEALRKAIALLTRYADELDRYGDGPPSADGIFGWRCLP